MRNINKIILLLITFVLISTYAPSNLNLLLDKKDSFFKIKNIIITNNNLITENEINKKLSHIYGKNILTIDKQNLEKPLLTINFLNKIEVKKKYPNTIAVKIFETKPIGVLFKNDVKYFLDSSSNLISFDEEIEFDALPNIFGEEAEDHFLNFLNLLIKNNFQNLTIKNYYYYQIGRWDLQLFDDKIVKFPNSEIEEAIQKSIEILKREDFKKYNIIDLRIRDKIIVE